MSIIKSTGAGDPASTGFYSHTINQSLRFNDGDSAYLSRTPSSASNRRTFTFSAWIKVNPAATNYPPLFNAGTSAPDTVIRLDNTGKLQVVLENGGGGDSLLATSARLRDPSSFYHIVCTIDTTNATADDRIKIYINGTEQTSYSSRTNPSLNLDTNVNNTVLHKVGAQRYASYWDGYMAEVHFLDGLAYDASYFGETKDGVWIPKAYSGSHGTNGFHLPFDDSSAIGDDESANTNDFTATNLVASDITSDSPTQNFATLMPMPNIGLSEGNLKMTTTRTGNWDGTIGSFGVTSGKWYYEVRPTVTTDSTFRCVAGWQGNQASQTVTYNGKGASGSPYGTLFDNYLVNVFTTSFYKDGGTDGTMTAASSGDVINVAADFDNGKIYFGINGTYYANDGGTDGNPGAGTNESMSGIDLTASEYVPAFHIRSDNATGGNQMIVNFGQEGTFVGTETAGGNSDANGVGNFFNAVPSGFLSLASSNLPDPTIGPGQSSQSDDHFNTVLYTGNGSTQSITGVGFQPDWTWLKSRSAAQGHNVFDVIRGANKALFPNDTNAEFTDTDRLNSFDSDGFSLGADANINTSSATYVSWNWKAGGSASSNSDGTITSSVSANQDAGFSIISWTGSGADGTIGHGLTQTPEFFITKDRNNARNWEGFHKDLTAGYVLYLNLTIAQNNAGNTYFQGGFSASDTNDTTIALSSYLAQTSKPMIGYAFHSVEGYSKVSSFQGNNANYPNGTFVLTGFRPALVMVKAFSTNSNWIVTDNQRASSFNGDTGRLYWNTSGAETAYNSNRNVELFSNGFTVHGNSASDNANRINESASYIYLAFAEAPHAFANAR